MIKAVLPYILVFCFLWFMPDLYLFSKNASNYIYKEATSTASSRVEVKIVKKLPYLPLKYAVLATGQKSLRVELMDTSKDYAISAPVDDSGVAVIESVPHGTYKLLVGPEVTDLTPSEIMEFENGGRSVLDENTLLTLSTDTVDVLGDIFIAPVIKE